MPVALPQLDAFCCFLEHICEHPQGPYRPARVARALSAEHETEFTATRVRRWCKLLAGRGWLRLYGKDYFQGERFQRWGRSFAGQLFMDAD